MSKINKIKVKGEVYSINDLATQEALNSEVERAYTSEENIKKDFEGILAKVDDSFNRLNTLTQNSGEGSIQEQINKSIENKQDKLISGVNIKTVNGKSILGSGEVISDNSIGKNKFSVDVQNSLKKADTAIQDISGKQNKLISGNNIKTINGLSLMGSGNIDLETLSGSSSADIAPHSSTLKVESTENNTTLTGNTIGGDEIAIDFPAATSESAGVMSAEDKKEQVKKTPLVNGDIIVGQTREIYSRQGKVDSATFLKRTTAGSTSVSDGVASIKQIGGNIVKNLVDGTFENGWVKTDTGSFNIINGFAEISSKSAYNGIKYPTNAISGHIYYASTYLYGNIDCLIRWTGNGAGNSIVSCWGHSSLRVKCIDSTNDISIVTKTGAGNFIVSKVVFIDLTEMFGAGKEPTKEECDRMFGTMDALPQGLTIAEPTGLKSTGYNQWNPENVLLNKSIVENAIADDVTDRHIAIVECLPCKIGAGENNGYIIGYGEGGSWSEEDIEVYFSPLNPMEVEGELYMHKLEMDSDYGTFVPECKGYLLIVTPTTDKLCVHLYWSGDRELTDYEEYIESNVALPTIPEMSEWGLAGISASGTMAQDTIDLDRMIYIKRIGRVDLGSLDWRYTSFGFFEIGKAGIADNNGCMCGVYTSVSGINAASTIDKTIATSKNNIRLKDSTYTDVESLKIALQGVMLYYELAEPEEYPIVTKTAPNYIGSDYGVEEFIGSKIPLAANILFYMRSLVGETRNFIDQLYTNTQKSDVKEVANYITNGIEDNKQLATNAPNLALRALYVAAGAKYNESTGYYELNGIIDLTESDMIYIYEHKNYHSSLNTARYFQENKNVRTIFPMNTANTVYDQLFKNNKLSLTCSFTGSNLEVIKFSKAQTLEQTKGIPTESGSMSSMFTNAKKLKTVYPIDVSAVTSIGTSFDGTIALIDVRLCGLKCSAIFKDSANISKESVQYIIQYALPTSAITITLHPDAYTRLVNDADIVAALEAQPLVTLVSA